MGKRGRVAAENAVGKRIDLIDRQLHYSGSWLANHLLHLLAQPGSRGYVNGHRRAARMSMAKLNLSVAVRDYDRTRPLSDGLVQIDGVDPVFMALDPEEIFFRAFRHAEFDMCELSLSSFTVKTAQGTCPYVGVPAFVSRAFRHTAVYVRTDRIKKSPDLKGKKVGVPEYQLTANVWVRVLLQDDYGVKPADIHWIRGGLVEAGRVEKIAITLPKGVRLEDVPAGRTLSSMLEAGEIDGFIGPRVPAPFERGHSQVRWLFADPMAAAKDYFKRTGFSRSCI
jgi:4,5-dihydroxyphthalate decarboxylase